MAEGFWSLVSKDWLRPPHPEGSLKVNIPFILGVLWDLDRHS